MLLMNELGEFVDDPSPDEQRARHYASCRAVDPAGLKPRDAGKPRANGAASEARCRACGKPLVGTHGRRYCSDECRRRAEYARRKQRALDRAYGRES